MNGVALDQSWSCNNPNERPCDFKENGSYVKGPVLGMFGR